MFPAGRIGGRDHRYFTSYADYLGYPDATILNGGKKIGSKLLHVKTIKGSPAAKMKMAYLRSLRSTGSRPRLGGRDHRYFRSYADYLGYPGVKILGGEEVPNTGGDTSTPIPGASKGTENKTIPPVSNSTPDVGTQLSPETIKLMNDIKATGVGMKDQALQVVKKPTKEGVKQLTENVTGKIGNLVGNFISNPTNLVGLATDYVGTVSDMFKKAKTQDIPDKPKLAQNADSLVDCLWWLETVDKGKYNLVLKSLK